SVLSEEEKAKKMEQIDAQTEKKKKDLRKKQANADKAMAIFNIGINAAQAIMKAWADLGFPAALPLSILIGALAAVQIALVAAQPIPLAEGGLARKKQGGIPATIAEGGQDELILPMSTGVRMLSESLTDNIAKTFAATGGARVAAAPVSGSSPAASFNRPDKHYHVHTRTLIADRAGLKWLFREFKEIEVSEATRVGAIA
ncbi:MAG: hypothetical protein KJN62_02495, partial [Deltaproteobacteria bacterium]|nr:hypothetical protein [Deltaproteobacteria bacterium]